MGNENGKVNNNRVSDISAEKRHDYLILKNCVQAIQRFNNLESINLVKAIHVMNYVNKLLSDLFGKENMLENYHQLLNDLLHANVLETVINLPANESSIINFYGNMLGNADFFDTKKLVKLCCLVFYLNEDLSFRLKKNHKLQKRTLDVLEGKCQLLYGIVDHLNVFMKNKKEDNYQMLKGSMTILNEWVMQYFPAMFLSLHIFLLNVVQLCAITNTHNQLIPITQIFNFQNKTNENAAMTSSLMTTNTTSGNISTDSPGDCDDARMMKKDLGACSKSSFRIDDAYLLWWLCNGTFQVQFFFPLLIKLNVNEPTFSSTINLFYQNECELDHYPPYLHLQQPSSSFVRNVNHIHVLFDTELHGFSITQLQKRLLNYTSSFLIVLESSENHRYMIAMDESIADHMNNGGSYEALAVQLSPTFRVLSSGKGIMFYHSKRTPTGFGINGRQPSRPILFVPSEMMNVECNGEKSSLTRIVIVCDTNKNAINNMFDRQAQHGRDVQRNLLVKLDKEEYARDKLIMDMVNTRPTIDREGR
ncbi:hypothetical protein SNEBB_006290 [Seison nebaliae]|nr:hypothetical protein SNEBB_006290 [Seison nebaliae]